MYLLHSWPRTPLPLAALEFGLSLLDERPDGLPVVFGGTTEQAVIAVQGDLELEPIVLAIVGCDPCGNGNTNTIYHLREGIERFLITDINNPGASAEAQSEIFIMYDRVATDASRFSHVPGGANVLYLDGHVEFVRYPGQAPLSVGLAASLGATGGDNP